MNADLCDVAFVFRFHFPRFQRIIQRQLFLVKDHETVCVY